MRRMLMVLALLAFVAPALAEPRVLVLSKAEGLPSPYARALVRLRDGSLLVAMMAEQGVGVGMGAAWIRDGKVTPLRGPACGLRSDSVTALAAAPAGVIWAATAKGLHRFEDGRFEPVGPAVSLSLLAVSEDGAVWAAGETAVVRVQRGEVEVLRPKGSVRRPLRLLARSGARAWLVAEDGILEADETSVRALPLTGSPLHFAGPQRGERRMPPVWLFDAALGGDGRLYVIGATRRLVAWDGVRFATIAQGHFAHLATIEGAPTYSGTSEEMRHALYVTAFDHSLRRLDTAHPTAPPTIMATGGADLGRPWADPCGAVWVSTEPGSNERHTMMRLGLNGTVVRWPLSRGTYLSPGILDAACDGQGGLWTSTNDGVWHLLP